VSTPMVPVTRKKKNTEKEKNKSISMKGFFRPTAHESKRAWGDRKVAKKKSVVVVCENSQKNKNNLKQAFISYGNTVEGTKAGK